MADIIVTFDADMQACGLAIYDVKKRLIVRTAQIAPENLKDFVREITEDYGRNCLFRIEIPDAKAAYGAAKGGKERDSFMRTFDSGKAAGVALVFERICTSFQHEIEIVLGSQRLSFVSQRKYGALSSLITSGTTLGSDILAISRARSVLARASKNGQLRAYPTKWTLKTAQKFFPELKHGNGDVLDAVGLLYPEFLDRYSSGKS